MKRILLFSAVALILVSCNNKPADQSAKQSPIVHNVAAGDFRIAVVNTDTLLNGYSLAIEANEELISKQEDLRNELNQKVRNLQNEMMEFQSKLENNAFLSRDRAESEQNRLIKKEQDLQMLEQTRSQDLMMEQQDLSMRLLDSINSAIRVVNASGEYYMIVSTSSMTNNILYCAPQFDVTDEVLVVLNERYEKK